MAHPPTRTHLTFVRQGSGAAEQTLRGPLWLTVYNVFFEGPSEACVLLRGDTREPTASIFKSSFSGPAGHLFNKRGATDSSRKERISNDGM
jgi:hypothetical protein